MTFVHLVVLKFKANEVNKNEREYQTSKRKSRSVNDNERIKKLKTELPMILIKNCKFKDFVSDLK